MLSTHPLTINLSKEDVFYDTYIKTALHLLATKSDVTPEIKRQKAMVAVEQLTKAVDLFPHRPTAYNIRASAYSILDKKSERDSDLKKNAELKLKDAEAKEKHSLAKLPVVTANVEELIGGVSVNQHIEQFRRQHEVLIKHAEKSLPAFDPDSVITGVVYAHHGTEAHLNHQDHARAIHCFDLAIQFCPYNTTALLGRSSANAALKNYDAAIQSCTEVIKLLCPTERNHIASAFYLRGKCYFFKNLFSESRADYLNMMILDPLGKIFDSIGQSTPGRGRRNERLENPAVMLLFSHLKKLEQEYFNTVENQMVKKLTYAIIEEPLNFEKYMARGGLVKGHDRSFNYAIAAWLCGNSIASRDSKWLPSEIFRITRTHFLDSSLSISKQYHVIFVESNNVDEQKKSQNNKEYFNDLINKGREKLYGDAVTPALPSEAIPYFNEAIAIHPDDEKGTATILLGFAHRKLAQHEKALTAFQHALKKNPKNKKAQALCDMTQKIMQGIVEFSENPITVAMPAKKKNRKKKNRSHHFSGRFFQHPDKAHSIPTAVSVSDDGPNRAELLKKADEEFKKKQADKLKNEEMQRD